MNILFSKLQQASDKRLKKADVLGAPQLVKSQFGTAKADMVITVLPHRARPWHHALACFETVP
jgi:hypothetical protein